MPISKSDLPKKGKYVVKTDRCVWGKLGEEVELELTVEQELSHIQAGTLERAPARESVKTRPTVAVKQGK